MPRIIVSAGEPSGDEHAARVIAALAKIEPELEVQGMGGRQLKAQGMGLVVDSEIHGSLMGFTEVVRSASSVWTSWQSMKGLLLSWKPDALMIVDYPDFNLRLASVARKLGIPVFYYITPQVWAWRQGRVRTIDKLVDLAAVIFPFEKSFFEASGFSRSVFVGHPFTSTLSRFQDPEAEVSYRNLFLLGAGLDPHRKYVAILPGSRSSEIRRHLGLAIATAAELKARRSSLEPVFGVAPAVESMVQKGLEEAGLNIPAVTGKTLDLLRTATSGLLKSGTSNLQAAFFGLPLAMYYRASRISEFIVKRFVSVGQYSIVNVIRPDTIQEFLQEEATPEALADEAERLAFDAEYRSLRETGLAQVREQLERHDPHPAFKGAKDDAERTARLLQTLYR